MEEELRLVNFRQKLIGIINMADNRRIGHGSKGSVSLTAARSGMILAAGSFFISMQYSAARLI